jgi:hypothetical protein
VNKEPAGYWRGVDLFTNLVQGGNLALSKNVPVTVATRPKSDYSGVYIQYKHNQL